MWGICFNIHTHSISWQHYHTNSKTLNSSMQIADRFALFPTLNTILRLAFKRSFSSVHFCFKPQLHLPHFYLNVPPVRPLLPPSAIHKAFHMKINSRSKQPPALFTGVRTVLDISLLESQGAGFMSRSYNFRHTIK